MKRVVLLVVIVLAIFVSNIVAEEVILSTSLNGSEYFQGDKDVVGERISGDAIVRIQGDSVKISSEKGTNNLSSVRYYLTVRQNAEAIRLYIL
ncbi:MAG: hypothetical protein PHY72_00005 [Candidatus Pacebacteria bacterium]|nr:hypothetical protein [Candidatus Paceibacterota bacterium]